MHLKRLFWEEVQRLCQTAQGVHGAYQSQVCPVCCWQPLAPGPSDSAVHPYWTTQSSSHEHTYGYKPLSLLLFLSPACSSSLSLAVASSRKTSQTHTIQWKLLGCSSGPWTRLPFLLTWEHAEEPESMILAQGPGCIARFQDAAGARCDSKSQPFHWDQEQSWGVVGINCIL
jgi:hypothetical protein